MNVNGRKTKEMMIGPISKDPPAYLWLCGASVDRVATFELLGVFVSCDLKWSEHVDAVVSKAASHLHFLKQLKRAGAPIRDFLHFYISVLRPILEYACPVWHSSLTASQSNVLESVQKRAISMIYSGADYDTSLIVAGIDSLRDRREKLTARFFKRQVLASSSPIHYMLPDHHDNDTVSRLRNPKPFQTIQAHTNKFYKSFLPFCLDNYT